MKRNALQRREKNDEEGYRYQLVQNEDHMDIVGVNNNI